jgi:hypothetical protein
VCILLCITICKSDKITVTTTKLPDDGPCETETCSSEARLIININLEVFVVVTVILSLLHIKIIYFRQPVNCKYVGADLIVDFINM